MTSASGRTARVPVHRVEGSGAERTVELRDDELIVEEPLSIQLDGTLVSTTMRTPGHDEELAVGFCLTEGLLADVPVIGVRHCGDVDAGQTAFNVITVDTGCLAPAPTPRLGNVSSSCGWCGSEHIDELCARLDRLPLAEPVDLGVIASVPTAARATQDLFARTGSVHAAAIFDRAGEILLTREDVGRHNAVDKVVGALALGVACEETLPATGLGLFVSGRASIEMVHKAWAGGFSALVAVSAPTALAVDAAQRANLFLAGFVRDDSFNVYSPSAAADWSEGASVV